MSVAATTTTQSYPGPTGTVFPFPYPVALSSDIQVYRTGLTTGYIVGSALILGTDYTLSGIGGASCTVTLTADLGQYGLLIKRVVSITQEVVLDNQGAFFPKAHEGAFDKLTEIDQQQQEEINRSLKVPEGSLTSPNLPFPSEGKVLGWVGDTLQNYGTAQTLLTSNLLDLQNLGLLPSDSAAFTVTKNPSDSSNPNIVALFRNTSDAANYSAEVHVRLQAGTSASHRAYFNFANYDGVDKWVTGRNAESCWILYNSETIHRLWMDPGASGPDPSFRTGNTYLNSAESGKIRFNWHPSDRTGMGGIEVWSGGNNGSGVTNNSCLIDSYPDAEPVGFTATVATNVLTVTAVDPAMGSLAVGMCIVASGIANGVYIASPGTGSGGTGTYNLSATVGTLTSRHMAAFSGQTNFYSTKNAGVGTGAINCFGGAYIARDLRVDGIATLSGAVNVGGILTGTQIIANKAMGSDMIKFQESGVTKWSIYAQITGGIAFFNSALGAAGFSIDATSHVDMAGAFASKVYTVATLPATGIIGQRAFVSDATSATFAAMATGGGANYVPVYRDNTGWKVG